MPAKTIARCALAILFSALAALFLAAPAGAKADRAQAAAFCKSSNSALTLAAIFNTRDSDIGCLSVTFAGNRIVGLRIETHRFIAQADAQIAERIRVKDFPVAQIESNRGAVLDGAQGHDAVILQGHVGASGGDAELVTSYLYNGLTGEYRSCRLRLDHGADAATPAWRLVNQFNETISRIVVRTRRLPLLGTIGIENLEGACTPTQS